MWAIRTLQFIGQATDVKDDIPLARVRGEKPAAESKGPAKSTVAT